LPAMPAPASDGASTTRSRPTSRSWSPSAPPSDRQPILENLMRMKTYLLALASIATTASLTGCKGFLDVSNPGPIEDVKLQTPDAVPALVVGMSADYANVLDEMVRITAIASDELGHGGSYTPEGLGARRIIRPEYVRELRS